MGQKIKYKRVAELELEMFQDMLPKNMSPWHIWYFKWKEFKNMVCVERTSDFPLKKVIKPSCERSPPNTCREGASLSSKTRDIERHLNKQILLFPQSTTSHLPSSTTSFQDFSLFIKPSIKHSGVTVSLGFYFLMKASMTCKTLSKYTCMVFSRTPVFCYRGPSQKHKRVKIFFHPLADYSSFLSI